MAFVSQSPRKVEFKVLQSSGEIGPGNYTKELSLCGSTQQTFGNNKKFPAFGQKEIRKLNEVKASSKLTPGPGSYNCQKDLVNTAYNKEYDECVQYMIKDNGHLNKRMQVYALQTAKDRYPSNDQALSILGPGSYEVNTSSFQKAAQRSNSKRAIPSPTHGSQMQLNQSSPSIPSRYLMPNLDFDAEGDSQGQGSSTDYIINSKVRKLIEDKNKLGPGCYNIKEETIRKSHKATEWGASKTHRGEHFVKNSTKTTVGPGYYASNHESDQKLVNQSFNRQVNNRSQNLTKQKIRARGGSIKDNFDGEDSSSDEGEQKHQSPGPGEYLQEAHVSVFANLKTKVKPDQFQFFGSSVDRFQIQGFNNTLGPGQYHAHNDQERAIRNKTFQAAGSSSFVGTKRDTSLGGKVQDTPGPGDYNGDKSLKYFIDTKIGRHSNVFASNIDRFKDPDPIAPGPGKYPLPGSMPRTTKNSHNSNFKSKTKRELEFKIDKDIPGAGQYNSGDYNSFFVDNISGGAPNNFLLLAKAQESARKDKFPQTLRFQNTNTTTPQNLGPGSYHKSKNQAEQQKIIDNIKVLQSNQVFVGKSQRFRNNSTEVPGPGQYGDLNMWHKKTYNLKFLNVQTIPCISDTPSSQ